MKYNRIDIKWRLVSTSFKIYEGDPLLSMSSIKLGLLKENDKKNKEEIF
jgi:hypothetical protein